MISLIWKAIPGVDTPIIRNSKCSNHQSTSTYLKYRNIKRLDNRTVSLCGRWLEVKGVQSCVYLQRTLHGALWQPADDAVFTNLSTIDNLSLGDFPQIRVLAFLVLVCWSNNFKCRFNLSRWSIIVCDVLILLMIDVDDWENLANFLLC